MASGPAVADKTVDREGVGHEDAERPFTFGDRFMPPVGMLNRDALMKEIREHHLQRENNLTTAESSKSVENNLNRSKSLPLGRHSSRRKYFVNPKNDLTESKRERTKVGNSITDLDIDLSKYMMICRNTGVRSLNFGDETSDSEDEDSDTDGEWDDLENSQSKQKERSIADHNHHDIEMLRRLMYIDVSDDEPGDLSFWDLDLTELDDHPYMHVRRKTAPNFPCGPEFIDECLVCFEQMLLRKRLCCDFAVCDDCMEKYLTYEVERGVVRIECINGTCVSYIHRDEILGRLPPTIKDKYYRFLVDANKDPNIKTCPRCSNIYNKLENGILADHGKYGVKVECPDCHLDWCFECQAPFHTNIKCKDFRKGDELLKSWAKEHHFGHQNAQKCPRCKIFIERKGGCDHMTCTKCHTSFCYRCGDRFVDLKFFGNHLSRLSPLGCKYNYKPDEPVKRRLVRGSLLGAQLLGGVLLVGLGLAAGAVLVGASVVILPVLGGIKLHKARKIRRRRKQQSKLFKMRSRQALIESLREQRVSEYARQRSRIIPLQEPRDGPVHIGIQTGPSQQVDVTVHNPYHPDGPSDEANLNSEITLNIKDEQGQITKTTAEIVPGDNNTDEGDVVLHVKTEYTNPPNSNPPQQSPDVVRDSEKESSFEASGRSTGQGSVSSRGSSRNSLRKLAKAKRNTKNSGPQSEVKESKRLENGHSIKKSKDLTQISDNFDLPDLGLSGSSNSSQENEEHLSDKEQTGPISHSETGCFLSLFSKKPQTSEKEKQSVSKINFQSNMTHDQTIPQVDKKEKHLHGCPDVVSCTLQAATKTKGSESFQDKPDYTTQSSCSSSEFDDSYLGIISTESYTTFL